VRRQGRELVRYVPSQDRSQQGDAGLGEMDRGAGVPNLVPLRSESPGLVRRPAVAWEGGERMEPPEATCRHRCLPRITCSQLPLIFDPPGGQDSPDEYREYTQKVIPGDAASHNSVRDMISSFYASSDPLPTQVRRNPLRLLSTTNRSGKSRRSSIHGDSDGIVS
jgi:hypothetical protein